MKYLSFSFLWLLIFVVFSGYCMEGSKGENQIPLIGFVEEFFQCLGETCPDATELIQESDQQDALRDAFCPEHVHQPIFASWREEYNEKARQKSKEKDQNIQEKKNNCPFCTQLEHREDDDKNYFIQRGHKAVSLFNRNPYSPLHFLFLPFRHVRELENLDPIERREILSMAAKWLKFLKKCYSVSGANIFFNLEDKCSGASLPDHLHCQLLSRWEGDLSCIASRFNSLLVEAEREKFFQDIKNQHNDSRSTKVYNVFARLLKANNSKKKQIACESTCVLCSIHNNQEQDEKNLVIRRFKSFFIMLNQFGYAPGHVMIVMNNHTQRFCDLGEQTLQEYADVVSLTQEKIKEIMSPHGLSIFINDGAASGNQFGDHLCGSIVPRWDNDMASNSIATGRILHSKSHGKIFRKLKDEFEKRGSLPNIANQCSNERNKHGQFNGPKAKKFVGNVTECQRNNHGIANIRDCATGEAQHIFKAKGGKGY